MWISYSKYSTFRQCPLKYQYVYIEKRPTVPAPALFFGGAIHECLEYLHGPEEHKKLPAERRGNDHRTLHELFEFLDVVWAEPKDFDDKTLEEAGYGKERAMRILTEYYDKHVIKESEKKSQRPHEPTRAFAVEKKFKIDFDGDVINGIIDRVDKIDGGYEIIDYKTNKKAPSRLFEEHLDQLAVYKWAAEEGLEWVNKFDSGAPLNFAPVAKIGLFFVVPEVNDKVLAGRDLDVPAIKKKVRTAINGIKDRTEKLKAGDTDAFPATGNNLCNWCDFKEDCPAVRSKK